MFSRSLLPSASVPSPKSSGIRTYEKRARNPFRIRTSKSLDLKSFRIRTYRKTPGGGGPAHSPCLLASLLHCLPASLLLHSLLATFPPAVGHNLLSSFLPTRRLHAIMPFASPLSAAGHF